MENNKKISLICENCNCGCEHYFLCFPSDSEVYETIRREVELNEQLEKVEKI